MLVLWMHNCLLLAEVFYWAVNCGPLSVLIGDMVLCHDSVNNSSIFTIPSPSRKLLPFSAHYSSPHTGCEVTNCRYFSLLKFTPTCTTTQRHAQLTIPFPPCHSHIMISTQPCQEKRKHSTIPSYDNLLCDEDGEAPVSRSAIIKATWYSTNEDGC